MLGAVLAGVAAISGLWFQAVATFWSQEIAKDQLEQSREEDAREVRAQAEQVTFWVENQDGSLHVANRSASRIPHLEVLFFPTLRSRGLQAYGKGEVPDVEDGVAMQAALSPCTEYVWGNRSLRSGFPSAPLDVINFKQIIVELHFFDQNGLIWQLTHRGLAESRQFSFPLRYVEPNKPEVKPVKSVGECGPA
ncbi:hypothetical protein [Streptomyces chartreusis]|uniref:hypothetical protein n=1 Tax=Streptomyces chartreusis TaxID=1969 RepID=UPI00363AD0AF